jgi:glycosyltransferase involved in cell wall biosynthesis
VLLRVGLIVGGESHFSPGVKPFLAFAKCLPTLGSEAMLLDVGCSPRARAKLEAICPPAQIVSCHGTTGLIDACRNARPDVLITDDAFDRVRLGAQVKAAIPQVCAAVYIHVFYGLHSIRRQSVGKGLSISSKVELGASRLIPFSLLGSQHSRLLRKYDLCIANSQFTELLAHLLYGIHPDVVIHPPIDVALFNPGAGPSIQKSGVLVFVGSNLDRPPEAYLPILRELSLRSKETITLFGDRKAGEEIKMALGGERVTVVHDVEDEELVRVYRRHKVTYIAQDWEDFGNVGPESLLCGTPVVMELAQPWTEIVGSSPFIKICRGGDELVENLVSPDRANSHSWTEIQSSLVQALSPQNCTAQLVKLFQGKLRHS